jgi:hypothetical protein
VRGEKALARAIKLGSHDAETRLWHERAVLYSGLQQRKGLAAVAEQVGKIVPQPASIPAPTLAPFEDLSLEDSDAGASSSSRRAARCAPFTATRGARPADGSASFVTSRVRSGAVPRSPRWRPSRRTQSRLRRRH